MNLNNKIEICEKLRPCLVFCPNAGHENNYGKKALFHRWFEFESIASMPKRTLKGLVEYEDGLVDTVNPIHIRFLDPKHHEYDFSELEGKDVKDERI